MRKVEMTYINEYGEKTTVSREYGADWGNLTEIEFLHDTYKAFLNNFGYPVNMDEKIAIIGEDERGEYCCDEDNEESFDINSLKDHAKEIADLVAEEFSKAHKSKNWITIEGENAKLFNDGKLVNTLKIPSNTVNN
jgi:hypothetical protein